MLSCPRAQRRPALALEWLEDRLVMSGELTIPLDPSVDRFGDQIVTVQAYQDSSRMAFGIFDTGASAITFSASDQAQFAARGLPIPIKVPNGAVATGIGGRVVGDVSDPGLILADGLHAAQLSYDANGLPTFQVSFGPTSAAVANLQVFVGTPDGSPNMPTITGTPILAPSAATGQGRAALIEMEGVNYDFSATVAGLSPDLPDLSFVSPGYNLQARSGTTDPVRIPLSLVGPNNLSNPGRQISEAPNPVQSSVKVTRSTVSLGGRRFLFDTGAQMSVISPGLARDLGFDLSAPIAMSPLHGVGAQAFAGLQILNDLVLPRGDGGTLRFTDVPVYVADVGNGLDGVLGMNLFNSAVAMCYDPYGTGMLTVLFTNPVEHGAEVDPAIATALAGAGIPFADTFEGTSMPAFAVASGEISGVVFRDFNGNTIQTAGETPIPNVTMYLDGNNNGFLENGEAVTSTDLGGNFVFAGLLPGEYIVREVVPEGLVLVSPPGGAFRVTVRVGVHTGGLFFANVDRSFDEQSAFVSGLYGSLLDRPPDAGGLNSWLGSLYQGISRDVVARGIWESAEHRGRQVDRYYAVYLNRAADPAGRAGWVGAFLRGATELDVQIGFLSSSEYVAANTSDAAFVGNLYVDILNRTADPNGQANWVTRLRNGMRRSDVARSFLTSAEGYHRILDRYYADYLNRPADENGRQHWTNELVANRYNLESAALGFLASGEFFSRQRVRLGFIAK